MLDPKELHNIAAEQDFYPSQPYNTPAILDFGESISLDIESLLDIGCGDGQLLRFLKLRNAQVMYAGLTAPGTLTKLPKSEFMIVEGDMHELPWPDSSFDAVTARHVLEHSVSPLLALQEINRVLRSGGFLYAVMPDASSDWIAEWEDHYSVLTPQNWRKLFRDAGFEIDNFRESHWLASYSMAMEKEYHFRLRKKGLTLSPAIARRATAKIANIESGKEVTQPEYDLIVVLHDLVYFRAIEGLLQHFKKNLLILLPELPSEWGKMLEATESNLIKSGWNVERTSNLKKPVQCRILLSPYNYDAEFPVNFDWTGRFLYGLAKDEWNFNFDNNVPFDFVFSHGPIDDAVIGALTTTVRVGNMKVVPKKTLSGPKNNFEIVYLPTYGEHSQFDSVIQELHKLSSNYRVSVKLHHGLQFLQSYADDITKYAGIKFHHSESDLMEVISEADLVVCDVSGAIYDSILANKPIFVIDCREENEKDVVQRFLEASGQIQVINEVGKTREVLENAILNLSSFSFDSKNEIFWHQGNEAVQSAVSFLEGLLLGTDDVLKLKLKARRRIRKLFIEYTQQIESAHSAKKEIVRAAKAQVEATLSDLHQKKTELLEVKQHSATLESENVGLRERIELLVELHQSGLDTINLLNTEIESLQNKLDSTARVLDSILESRTYRLFGPYRKIVGIFKKRHLL